MIVSHQCTAGQPYTGICGALRAGVAVPAYKEVRSDQISGNSTTSSILRR